MLYADNAATTPVLPAALEAAWPWLTSEFGNPSSTHELGLRAAGALSDARNRVANWLGVRASEITFTSGATESNNLAITGIALASPRGKHIISALTEHESVLRTLEFLERQHGFEIEYLPLNRDGSIDLDTFERAIRPDTTLVTLMTANNEIGTIHDIRKFAELAKARAVPFHTDAVQAPGWLDIKNLQVSALSLSGHKFGAPKGIGVLYCNSRLTLEPLIHGGGQEFERRSGTENVAWAVALATAIESLPAPIQESPLQNFIDSVLRTIPNAQLTGSRNRHPAIASFVFEGVNGETLLLELENEQVICSSGSACAAGKNEPSHVLTALGYEPDLAQTAVRFSFARGFSNAETEFALNALRRAYEKVASI